VLPRNTWDMWLADSLYELKPYDDAARFEGVNFARKLDNYPMPNPDGGDPIYQEVMMYQQGYISKTGEDAKPYIALIRPVWLRGEDGAEKFIFEMKLCQTVTKYQKAVPVPLPGETPVVLTAPPKAVAMQSIGDLLSQIAVITK